MTGVGYKNNYLSPSLHLIEYIVVSIQLSFSTVSWMTTTNAQQVMHCLDRVINTIYFYHVMIYIFGNGTGSSYYPQSEEQRCSVQHHSSETL